MSFADIAREIYELAQNHIETIVCDKCEYRYNPNTKWLSIVKCEVVEQMIDLNVVGKISHSSKIAYRINFSSLIGDKWIVIHHLTCKSDSEVNSVLEWLSTIV